MAQDQEAGADTPHGSEHNGGATDHTTGTEVPHSSEHSAAFPPLDQSTFAPQLIWLAITFTALYFLLSKFVLPRLGEIIEERRDRIQRDIDSAERLKNETVKAQDSYEQALADARANASAIAQETRAKLATEIDKERSKIEEEIASKVADAEARLTESKSNALASVNDIATETAIAVIDKLIGQNVSADEVRQALSSTKRT